ncbi:MAG: HAMP domain-containing sensor histidine kinase [Thiovulaceae bacterium]|nr:HAMP domain-containing sensor histidine kinase [Sulfurimonadaceae bacterium]
MIKLHKYFLYNFLGLYIATLLISSLVSYYALKSIILENSKRELIDIVNIVDLNLENVDNLTKYINSIHTLADRRLTIIDENGKVLAETNFNKEKMENHLKRIEIIQAKQSTFGSSVRLSATLNSRFLYVAKYTNSKKYIRVAQNLSSIEKEFYSIYIKIIIVYTLFMFIALVITSKVSKRVSYDINQISKYLNEISNKNYKAVIKTQYFSEFLQISLLLKNLVKKLANRDKKKRKHEAKMRLINKQRNDILSAISHEFKNPIAAIMGYTETIREDEKININIRNKFLDKILSNGKKMSSMIDRLALSIKLENNDLSISFIEFDIFDLCIEVANNLKAKYKDRGIDLKIEHQNIHADKTMLELVLINLADNALKYSEDNIEIKMTDNIIYINDNGIGFAESEIDKITSKFYRVRTNSWDNSMGLGLAIVSFILKLHHTTLLISSKPNVGSSFGFDLKPLIK